jgi:hypothetical protein
MVTTNEQVRLDVVMQCLQLMQDVDAAIEAATRILDFVATCGAGRAAAEVDVNVGAATVKDAGATGARGAGVQGGTTRWAAADLGGDLAIRVDAGGSPRPAVTRAGAERADRAAARAPQAPQTPHAPRATGPAAGPEADPRPPESGSAPVASLRPVGSGAVRSGAAGSGTAGVGRGAGPKRRWDAAAEDKLRAEWGTGKSVETIAEELGRTAGSVRERARRLGLSRPTHAEKAARQPQAETPSRGPDRRQTGRGRKYAGARRERAVRPAAEPVDLSNYRITRPPETMHSVVTFVRSRDYQVVQRDPNTFLVDGHKTFTQAEFVDWANGLRRMLKKPPFPEGLAAAS